MAAGFSFSWCWRVCSSRGHLPRESLANWLRSSVGRYRHIRHTGGVCGLGRPGAAPSRVDARSWERPFQRRDAKCITLCIQRSHQRHSLHSQRHSLHFIRLSRLRFARDLLMTHDGSPSRHLSDLWARDHGRAHRDRPNCDWKVRHRVCLVVFRYCPVVRLCVGLRLFLPSVSQHFLAQDSGRETHDWMIRIYHHTSQLRANSERAPLNSPSVSGHRLLRVSPGLLLSSFGAVLLLSSSCVALCVLICPDPSLRCCASLLLRLRPSFSLCVEAAVVCVAGGRRHEIAARAALRHQQRQPQACIFIDPIDP